MVLVVPDRGSKDSSKMCQSSFIWTGVRVFTFWSFASIHHLISAFCSAVSVVGPCSFKNTEVMTWMEFIPLYIGLYSKLPL